MAAAPEVGEIFRHLVDEAAGRREQHLQDADAEQDGEQLGRDPPVVQQCGEEP
jgi:hypothetical protein